MPDARQRLDKWLWVARFFRTRSLATAAVLGGGVRQAGLALKPAKEVGVGDALEIRIGQAMWQVTVLALASHRRPAPEARLLYAESDASKSKRQADAEMLRMAPPPGAGLKGRPTKKDRRQIVSFSRKGEN